MKTSKEVTDEIYQLAQIFEIAHRNVKGVDDAFWGRIIHYAVERIFELVPETQIQELEKKLKET